jgi:anti-sigma factor RsiW
MSENDLPADHLPPELEAELAAYADGRLSPAREAALEARFANDPSLAEAAVRQREAGDLIVGAAASVEAPTWLRIELDTLQARSTSTSRRRRRRLAWRPLAGLAAAAAVLALVLVVTLGGGGLTVEEAAAVGTRAPTASVAADPARPKLLAAEVDGVAFPDYAKKFGWKAVGQRTDEIDGRDMRTVFYERDGERIAYTIIAGDPLDEPGDAEPSTREGVKLLQFEDSGRTVVTWQRLGRTCVLSGSGVDAETLLELASWKGVGSVAF